MRHVVRAEARLAVAPDAVWRVLRAPSAWPDWDPYIFELRQISGAPSDPWQAGTRWRERVRRGPFRARFDLTAIDAGSGAVGWRTRYLFVTATHRWLVRPQGQHTLVESEEVFQGWGPVIVIAAGLLRLFRVRAMAAASLRALVDEVSAKTQPGTPPPRAGQEADRVSE